jgi:hypothetical protein
VRLCQALSDEPEHGSQERSLLRADKEHGAEGSKTVREMAHNLLIGLSKLDFSTLQSGAVVAA